MNLYEELISQKYASSYYNSKAETVEKKKTNLEKMIETVSKEINYFTHPIIPREVKKTLLDKISDSEIKKTSAFRLVEVLVLNGRIKLLRRIYEKFSELHLEKDGFEKVDVLAKNSLSENEKNKINEIFNAITGKKAMINFKKDDNIIGGVILKWKDKILDLTVDKRLRLITDEVEKELQL